MLDLRINGHLYIDREQEDDKIVKVSNLSIETIEDLGDEDCRKIVHFIDGGIFEVEADYADEFDNVEKLTEVRFGYNNPCYWIDRNSVQSKEYLGNGNIRYTITPAV